MRLESASAQLTGTFIPSMPPAHGVGTATSNAGSPDIVHSPPPSEEMLGGK